MSASMLRNATYAVVILASLTYLAIPKWIEWVQFQQYSALQTQPSNYKPFNRSSLSGSSDRDMESYLDSYTDDTIHQDMLRDRTRTLAYRNAILGNRDLFRGKVVMDVGAGTGILSMFAAQAGATRVYAVEASEASQLTSSIIRQNEQRGLIPTGVVSVLQKSVENLELPDNEKVDVIISEWMGYYLIYEGMLHSVLTARTKFLKPGGLMFPDRCNLYAAAFELPAFHYYNQEWWKNVYGTDMSAMISFSSQRSENPGTINLEPSNVVTDVVKIFDIDMVTVQRWQFDAWRNNPDLLVIRDANVDGLALWFDCTFPAQPGNKPAILDTSPFNIVTHWHQSLLFFANSLGVFAGETLTSALKIQYHINDWHCVDFDVKITNKIGAERAYKGECRHYELPYQRLASFWTNSFDELIVAMEDRYIWEQSQKWIGKLQRTLGVDLTSWYTISVFDSGKPSWMNMGT